MHVVAVGAERDGHRVGRDRGGLAGGDDLEIGVGDVGVGDGDGRSSTKVPNGRLPAPSPMTR